MHSSTTREIIKKLSLKHHLPISEVEKIIMVPQDIMYVLIKTGDPYTNTFNNTYIPGFGKFIVTQKKRNYLRLNNEKFLAVVEARRAKRILDTEEKNNKINNPSE